MTEVFSRTPTTCPEMKAPEFLDQFPMRMTSVEKFHWFDDGEQYPNVIFGRLRFEFPLDAKMARRSWELVLSRQPFSDICPEQGSVAGGKRWNWRSGRGQTRPISEWEGSGFDYQELDCPPEDWNYHDHRAMFPTGNFLSIARWPMQESGVCCQAMFHVHHAAVDGAAACQVINDWLVVYNNLMLDRPPLSGLQTLDIDRLKLRNHLGLARWSYLKFLPHQAIALFGAAKFLFRQVVEIPALRSDLAAEGDRFPFPAVVSAWLNTEASEELRDLAKRCQVTTNSILLSEWFHALGVWRQQRQPDTSEQDVLRVILPMSIRSSRDRHLPVANRATLVQIDRTRPSTGSFPEFYRLVDREVRIIRGWQLDKIFLIAIRTLSVSNWLLRKLATSSKSRGTTVFTNLGRPLSPLEKWKRKRKHELNDGTALADPVDYDFVGPIRRGTPVNLTVSRFAGRLRVSLHYDPRVLHGDEADKLLKLFLDCAQGRLVE